LNNFSIIVDFFILFGIRTKISNCAYAGAKYCDIHAKTLINQFGNAEAVFSARKKDLEVLEGIEPSGPIQSKILMISVKQRRKLIL